MCSDAVGLCVAVTDAGVTPMLAACGAGHVPVMKSLAATGVALDAKEPNKGRFPLYYAVRIPNLEVKPHS